MDRTSRGKNFRTSFSETGLLGQALAPSTRAQRRSQGFKPSRNPLSLLLSDGNLEEASGMVLIPSYSGTYQLSDLMSPPKNRGLPHALV